VTELLARVRAETDVAEAERKRSARRQRARRDDSEEAEVE